MVIDRRDYNARSEVILFINGQFPKAVPDVDRFQQIFCTDGAFRRLSVLGVKPDVISGDFDSVDPSEIPDTVQKIHTPDQNATDFEKSLRLIIEKGYRSVSVYGCSGLEQDHFLGNLTAMAKHKDEIEIRCFDDFGFYFFAENKTYVQGFDGKIISLFPFPKATNICSEGVKYPLHMEDLHITERIGTRNSITSNRVSISYETGNLLIFVQSEIT